MLFEFLVKKRTFPTLSYHWPHRHPWIGYQSVRCDSWFFEEGQNIIFVFLNSKIQSDLSMKEPCRVVVTFKLIFHWLIPRNLLRNLPNKAAPASGSISDVLPSRSCGNIPIPIPTPGP